MSEFQIVTSYAEFNKILEKAMINLGLGVYLTLKPIEKTTVENGITTIEKYVECHFTDETSGYTYDFVLQRQEINQLITLLQTIKGQLATSTDNNNTVGCSRQVVVK